MDKVKSCPFCGGEPKLYEDSIFGVKYVYMKCQKCYARTERAYIRYPNVKGTGYYTEEEAEQKAVEAWERRVSDARKAM